MLRGIFSTSLKDIVDALLEASSLASNNPPQKMEQPEIVDSRKTMEEDQNEILVLPEEIRRKIIAEIEEMQRKLDLVKGIFTEDGCIKISEEIVQQWSTTKLNEDTFFTTARDFFDIMSGRASDEAYSRSENSVITDPIKKITRGL